ncbi:metallophosphoesterase family protein [Halocalculus aciditolerans]|uniref:Phosphoesterase n=1 Tax=Halocalculus aciditolerans TaxID=1383812 RepID=A0A830F876_9EURY|nr:metallophosphoesterase family protein [Halocalculus aciditolerans]GGL64315.1 DNA repair protein [Halocalculus aciditolerans]
MRVALLADIHANQPALEAVLADLPPVEQVVCLGDIVGYNPMPSACVELVRKHADVVVQGNHDRLVETPLRMAGNQMAHAGLEYAQDALSSEQRAWLRDLPERATVDNNYLAVHSHPTRTDAYVFPDDVSELAEASETYDGVLLGHTHIQDVSEIDGTVVVNPGSVGQPRDGDPRAAYAILDLASGDISLRRAHYDVDRVYHEVVVAELPAETGERLFDGA